MKSLFIVVVFFLTTFKVCKGETFTSETFFGSDYVTDGGFVLSDSMIQQSFFSFESDGGDGFYLWENTEFGVGTTEIDLGAYYKLPSLHSNNWQFFTTLEYAVWFYPVRKFRNKPDHVVMINTRLETNLVDLSFEVGKTLTSGSGVEYLFGASRSIQLNESFSMTPSATFSYHDDYFGLSGPGVFRYGISGTYKVPDKRWSLSILAFFQEDLEGNFENNFLFGGGVGHSW